MTLNGGSFILQMTESLMPLSLLYFVLHKLMHSWSSSKQWLPSLIGNVATNAVEGFHVLALKYRDKRIDLGAHPLLRCKTNMTIT